MIILFRFSLLRFSEVKHIHLFLGQVASGKLYLVMPRMAEKNQTQHTQFTCMCAQMYGRPPPFPILLQSYFIHLKVANFAITCWRVRFSRWPTIDFSHFRCLRYTPSILDEKSRKRGRMMKRQSESNVVEPKFGLKSFRPLVRKHLWCWI